MFFKKEDDETSVWISNTDLMSGLLVLFLFISIIMTQGLSDANKKIREITGQSESAQQELKANIEDNFTSEEIKKYHLDKEIGAASFDEGGRFNVGSSKLTPEFQKTLKNFLPKYLKSINDQYEKDPDSIKEIRIEGHTSSEWEQTDASHTSLSDDEKYIKNMELSQSRTREIINFALSLPELQPYHKLIKDKLTANGLSSSKVKVFAGTNEEDKNASRRIEFRVVANDKETIDKLKEEVGAIHGK